MVVSIYDEHVHQIERLSGTKHTVKSGAVNEPQ
jgi:hypothetical protein